MHYVKDQVWFLKTLQKYLKPSGRLVLVEYNADRGNMWVPYRVSYRKLAKIAEETGYKNTTFISSVPSDFLNEIYSAVTFKN